MIETPSALQSKFEEHLRDKAIPDNLHGMYQKWLRFYLDFCKKYRFPPKYEKSLTSLSVQAKPITGASWKSEYARLADEIRVLHYSPKTLKTYQGRCFSGECIGAKIYKRGQGVCLAVVFPGQPINPGEHDRGIPAVSSALIRR